MNAHQAQALLERHVTDARVLAHCREVAAVACRIAWALREQGQTVDLEQVEVMGLLHDVGRARTHDIRRHGIEGFLLARSEGVGRQGRICLTHLLKGRNAAQGVEAGFLSEEEQCSVSCDGSLSDLSLEEIIVIVADMMVIDGGIVPIAEKSRRSRLRYGDQRHLAENYQRALSLEARLTEMLGRTPYQILQGDLFAASEVHRRDAESTEKSNQD